MSRKTDTQLKLEREYRKRNPNGHWFDTATMKFFNSKIHNAREVGEDIYFVSSEQPPHSARLFSLRRMDKNGVIHTPLKDTAYVLCINAMRKA